MSLYRIIGLGFRGERSVVVQFKKENEERIRKITIEADFRSQFYGRFLKEGMLFETVESLIDFVNGRGSMLALEVAEWCVHFRYRFCREWEEYRDYSYYHDGDERPDTFIFLTIDPADRAEPEVHREYADAVHHLFDGVTVPGREGECISFAIPEKYVGLDMEGSFRIPSVYAMFHAVCDTMGVLVQ